MATPSRKLTVLAVTLDGYGHINACLSIGQQLQKRGHRVVFAIEQAWTGTVARHGLEEVHYTDKTRDPSLGPNGHWLQFMSEYSKMFGLDPFEAVKALSEDFRESCFYTLYHVDDEIKTIIDTIKPDVILLDNYETVPAIYNSGIPYVLVCSAGPLICLPSDNLPPSSTGYPTDGDRSKWSEYLDFLDTMYSGIMERFNEAMIKKGVPRHPPGKAMHPSPHLNIYAYPLELDYLDLRPLPPKWKRFDHFIRQAKPDPYFLLPETFKSSPESRLIYVSMGSMGCADARLVKRLVDMLGQTRHRCIMSLGPQLGKIDLPSNIVGYAFLPQTQLLPLVDLVITHGGNNTFIESMYYGKPVLVCPLFADQIDNAQRALETGVGLRLNAYTCQPEEMIKAVESLLNDKQVKDKVESISKTMQSSNSTLDAALAVEEVALGEQGSKQEMKSP